MTVPLSNGTLLTNVRWAWIAAGVLGSTQSSGITQPDSTHAIFRINVGTPPANAEELLAWDNTDILNWNTGGYAIAFIFSLVNQLPPSSPAVIVPGPPSDLSLCRVFGYLEDLNNRPAANVKLSFTLVSLPTKSERILIGPIIKAKTDDQGRVSDDAGNPWIDLQRNDLLTPDTSHYLVNCEKCGFINVQLTLAATSFDLSTLI